MNSTARLALSNWTETEAGHRIDKLLATGWTVAQVARMFSVSTEEIDRLSGHFIPEKDCASVG